MNLKLKYIIVDDDELERIMIAREVAKFQFLDCVGIAQNPQEAFGMIESTKPDIIFSDIEMPGMSGLEMMKQMIYKVPVPIFISSHAEFAIDSFEVDAFDYILKPIDEVRFKTCMDRVYNFFELRSKALIYENSLNSNYIYIKEGYEKHKIYHKDILYFEAMKDYTRISVVSDKNYLVLESINNLLNQLPENDFLKIHRSYAINIHYITKIGQNTLFLNDFELPIGKTFRSILSKF